MTPIQNNDAYSVNFNYDERNLGTKTQKLRAETAPAHAMASTVKWQESNMMTPGEQKNIGRVVAKSQKDEAFGLFREGTFQITAIKSIPHDSLNLGTRFGDDVKRRGMVWSNIHD